MLGYARVLNTSRGDLNENPLKVGELVRLRSGGPAMTVGKVEIGGEGETTVYASWHDKHGVVQSTMFPVEMLKRVGRSFFSRRR
jgi:uncharacterized protein YodC (DUF2158 family)